MGLVDRGYGGPGATKKSSLNNIGQGRNRKPQLGNSNSNISSNVSEKKKQSDRVENEVLIGNKAPINGKNVLEGKNNPNNCDRDKQLIL